MRKLVRCHNQFKGESKKQTYVYISDTEINVQMEAGLAASAAGVEEGRPLNLCQVEFAGVWTIVRCCEETMPCLLSK